MVKYRIVSGYGGFSRYIILRVLFTIIISWPLVSTQDSIYKIGYVTMLESFLLKIIIPVVTGCK
jgi:hypothetical protein